MLTQPESQAVARQLYQVWFPQIVHNQHQEAPFPARIFVPPFEDPVNPHIAPLVVRGINTVGDAITRRLEQEGKVGAVSRLQFDTWWNGGMRTAPYFHNMIGILTETAHASATPATYDARTFPRGILFGPVDQRAERLLSVALSRRALDPARQLRVHDHRVDGRGRSRQPTPRGVAVRHLPDGPRPDSGRRVRDVRRPSRPVGSANRGGHDQHAAARRRRCRTGSGRVRRHRRRYEAGTFLIRGAQPFRAYLRDLLLPQRYPDLRQYPGGPPDRPYDITGWTLPLQMGVRVDAVAASVAVPTRSVGVAAPAADSEALADADVFAIDARVNNSVRLVNRIFAAGGGVERLAAPLDSGGSNWPPRHLPHSGHRRHATAGAARGGDRRRPGSRA